MLGCAHVSVSWRCDEQDAVAVGSERHSESAGGGGGGGGVGCGLYSFGGVLCRSGAILCCGLGYWQYVQCRCRTRERVYYDTSQSHAFAFQARLRLPLLTPKARKPCCIACLALLKDDFLAFRRTNFGFSGSPEPRPHLPQRHDTKRRQLRESNLTSLASSRGPLGMR